MRRLLPLSLFLLIPSARAFGWGCEGHQIVTLIARAHLTPAASAAVDRLLSEYPVDPAVRNRCKDVDLMADVSAWADEVRPSPADPWHYVNIPLTETRPGSLAAWCPPMSPPGQKATGCVVNAIQYFWESLTDAARSGADRAAALRYVIHFVGDIHQPLHTTDNNDEGANCTSMTFFDAARPANLHSLWDTMMIRRELGATKETTVDYARRLDREFGDRWPAWGTSPIDPTAWAWDSVRLARTIVYGELTPPIPAEKPDPKVTCDVEREKIAALHIVVEDKYFNTAMPVIDEQLAKAGYRLADLLNRTF